MSRGVQIFRQTDVARAIRGARAAGEEQFRVEITADGKISVIVGIASPQLSPPEPDAKADVDRWLKEHNAYQPEKP